MEQVKKPKYEEKKEYKIIYEDDDGTIKTDYGKYVGEDEYLIQFYIPKHQRTKAYNKLYQIRKIIENTERKWGEEK